MKKNYIIKNKLNRLDISDLKAAKKNKDQVDKKPHDKLQHYSGFIIVRLSDRLPLPSDKCKTLVDVAKDLRLPQLEKILERYELTATRRVIKSMNSKEIIKLEQKAAQTELPPLHSLTRYWRVDVRERTEQLEEIMKLLQGLFEVDRAYLELSVTDPVVNAANDPYNADQDYLDAAPNGIDARWAWTQPFGEGAGVRFIDLEQGWFPGHEDFATKSPAVIYGDNRDGIGGYKGNHGTAVLGEIIADDNTVGVVGIAPSISSVDMVSHYDAGTNTALHVADAILGALATMSAGDVLLLEVQRALLPTETDDADFDAIRLAVATGIVVVEAAGNGGNNLDIFTDGGDTIFNRGSADFRESGAIMVGAGASALPHNRLGFSNFGTRIDCYGWGENVVTCGYGNLDAGTGDNSTYTDSFNGTSSASPIVTGAAIVLQGMYEGTTGNRLSPLQMRALLSNPATGTPQGGGVAGNIGVMPNLRAIAENTLGLVPDVYLRDNLGDTGVVPSTGSISASPDIITRPALVANPQAAFGEDSGTENSNSLGSQVEAGQNNFLYVRMKNRGGADATGVRATVYWSEVSTLVTPDMWTLIGTTPAIDVPQGDTLVVTAPITWPSAAIPGTGHYCYVGILDHPGDPAPPVPGPTDWDGFRNFIRNQNNVTWRNFNVVDMDPNMVDPAALPFRIAGAPDKARFFDLEVTLQVAKGTRVWLEIPLQIAKQFLEGRNLKHEIDRKKQQVRVLLPALPKLYFPEMYLGKSARLKARFIIEGARKTLMHGNRISISQISEKQEVGRVTWQFETRKGGKQKR